MFVAAVARRRTRWLNFRRKTTGPATRLLTVEFGDQGRDTALAIVGRP
jgi:hypothetical protein